ncbi:MAG: FtsQ-type POTRA domain-containing protein [Oscillospiraceae bacterium]|jgi:cell division protein FtsQ|nr:FtsQ-type POTRA domain-containing protein [Oscillospiraceae bacterium]
MPKKRKKRRRRGGLGRLLRPLSIILAAITVVAALTLFFKVETILVTGAGRYSAADIIAASGVETGDNLVLLDRYRVSQRIYTALPYITDVRPKPKFPNTLEIEVTETQAAAAIQGAGGWWLLSTSGKILEAVDAPAAADYLQIKGIQAETPAVSSPAVLPEDSHLTAERLSALLTALATQEALPRADALDCSDSRKLVLHYDGRLQVEMFYNADFDFKITCMLSAVDKLEPNETGILRMTMEDDYEVHFIKSGG